MNKSHVCEIVSGMPKHNWLFYGAVLILAQLVELADLPAMASLKCKKFNKKI